MRTNFFPALLLFYAFLLPGTSPHLPAQESPADPGYHHAVGVNLMKLAMAMPNLEYLYHSGSGNSFHVFGEYALSPVSGHASAVATTGLRRHFDGTGTTFGWFLGIDIGLTWGGKSSGRGGLVVGGELGYQAVFGDRYYASPRALIHFHVPRRKPLWGLDANTGVLF
ncbi:MAG TPA: hypothetical protein VKA68_05865 [bacterium]|nr:hypothetical protein [bacterium]